MSSPPSCLYEARVFHRRLAPKPHQFLYRVFMFGLDLDDLPKLAQRFRFSPILGINRPALYSWHEEDHLGKSSAAPVRERLTAWLQERGQPAPDRIFFLTNLRVLGYVFNPISIFFCSRADGSPLPAVVQVGNTFGEQKLFLVPPNTPTSFAWRGPKNYYVSPFSDLDDEFEFRLELPTDSLRIFVDDFHQGEKSLVSSLTGQRRDLTALRLLAYAIKYPLITLQVITLIHFEALRLWWKKIPHRRKEDHPELQQDVLHPHRSLQPHQPSKKTN